MTTAKEGIVAAEVALDCAVAIAIAGALPQRLADLAASEAGLARRTVYKAARKTADDVCARLREYEEHAQAIIGILVDLARAELTVQAANRQLPAGAAPIEAIEFSMRGAPSLPAETLSGAYRRR